MKKTALLLLGLLGFNAFADLIQTSPNSGGGGGGTGTPGGALGTIQYNAGSGNFGGLTITGDCTLIYSSGVITCTKSNGTAFGTAAFDNTGTSGTTIPLLNGNNAYSGTANFTNTFSIGGTAETFPTSGLLVGTTDTQTLTGKSIAGSEINSGVVASTVGGTGVNNSATLTLGSSSVNLASLGTGIVKNTTTTGALTDATSADVIGLFSTCSGTQYLGADGSCHSVSASGVTSLTGDGTLYNNSASTGAVTLTLANQTANTVLGALTATTPSDLAVPSCSGANNALKWTSGTGFGCNTITPGTGTVTSVTFTGDGTILSSTPSSAVTTTGTLTAALANAAANSVLGNNTGSGAAPAYQNSINLTGTAATAAHTITSASATALAVGANGATNPVLSVDDSTSSVATGIVIKGAVTGGATTINATDSGANTGLTFNSKGTGNTIINTTSGTDEFTIAGSLVFQAKSQTGGTTLGFSPMGYTSNAVTHFLYTQAVDTGGTASTEWNMVYFNGAAGSKAHATGALATERDFRVDCLSDSFTAASTITNAACGAFAWKSAGTNATFTNDSAIYIPTQAITGTVGTSYAVNVAAATGATNNYAANFAGDITLTGAAPAVSSCGSGAIVTGSSDHKGQISGIIAATACTITFSQALATAPSCQFTGSVALASPSITSISTAAVTTGMTAFTGTLYYMCF